MRPEHQQPPEVFYDDTEASKYTANSRIQQIQVEMTERCIELLALPEDLSALILDIGCGSGLSGDILSEHGHIWIGCDVSPSMLEVALDREVEGDLFLQDIGQGIGLRPGSLDGAISVSVLQWLCNADAASHNPAQRLARFFNTLFASLSRGARAVFQFYPESDDQVNLILSYATKAGFGGGLLVDFPNSKKVKKYYLVLMAGASDRPAAMPAALGTDEHSNQVGYEKKRLRKDKDSGRNSRKKKHSDAPTTKEWISHKKDLYRRRGKEDVPNDSKYTGRKRRPAF